MNILHTEASTGWGGQEMRILKESLAMRERGHEVFFCVNEGGTLADKAREKGFTVYTFPMNYKRLFQVLFRLCRIIKQHHISVVNTHSSIDAWLGGIAAKLCGCHVVRTRHISAPIKPGANSKLLYKLLANFTVTTCEEVADVIKRQAGIDSKRCKSVPTGIDQSKLSFSKEEAKQFRAQYGIDEKDFLVGTACILRSWKGIEDLLLAANLLKETPHLKWIIIGSGPGDTLFRQKCRELELEDKVIFTGFIDAPYSAIASLDAFTLLSTANEGVSQASLQAAYLKKPLITTPTGGLKEVCIDEQTGYLVPIKSPQDIADRVLKLYHNRNLSNEMGEKAHELVCSRFLFDCTVNEMESIFSTSQPA